MGNNQSTNNSSKKRNVLIASGLVSVLLLAFLFSLKSCSINENPKDEQGTVTTTAKDEEKDKEEKAHVVYRCVWSIGTNELVEDAKLGSSALKKRREIAFGVGETVGKLKAIVRLDTLDFHTFTSKGSNDFSQEIG